MRQYNFKQILVTAVWILLGAGTIVLLVAAINKKNSKHCKAVEIKISGVQNIFFIDKKDVTQILEKINAGKLEGKAVATCNLAVMEDALKKKPWIKNAELFFDNNEVLRVRVLEREPVARVFTNAGTTFYIDNELARLPLSDKFSARVPVFTNFPLENSWFSKSDSNLLRDIKDISQYILNDAFWMAQIEQVDITPGRTFEMIPKIGNHIIAFGDAHNYAEKFNNLLTFYKQVETKVGWNKYSVINVQYKGQVVAVKRGAEDIKMDSLRAKELMKMLVANAQRQVDSMNNIQLVQPQEDNTIPPPPVINDDMPDEQVTTGPGKIAIRSVPENQTRVIEKPLLNTTNAPLKKPVILKSTSNEKPNPIPMKKTVTTKPVVPKSDKPKIPKALMPPKNDY